MVFTAVETADLELAAPEFWIVANAGQEFVDRLQARVTHRLER